MRVSKQLSADGKQLTIKISGRFDFSLHEEFRKSYEDARQTGLRFVIDLGATEYIDSAACGMLLVFRDAVGGDKADISVVNASPAIKKTLQLLQFQRLFNIA